MTGPAEPCGPRRRSEDKGRLGKFRAWWREWGQLITGAWLILISCVLLWVAVSFVRSKSATDTAARDSCNRSRIFGPPIANAYEKFGVLNTEQLKAYRATIPDVCPD